MTLNVAVIKTPSGVNLAEQKKTFGESGGSIGRGNSNTWVLDDPDRFLSSKHCELSFEGGQFYLTDMSTNGTFVNGSPEPIGKGGKVALNNGDTLELGDYQFQVEMNGAFAPPSQPKADPFAGDPFGAPAATADPFASSGGGDPFASSGGGDPFGSDPFGGSTGGSDPFASSDPFAKSDPFSGGSNKDSFSGSDPFSSPGSSDPLGGSDPFGQQDPLAGFDANSIGADPLGSDPLISGDQSSGSGGGFSSAENVDPLAAIDNAAYGKNADVFASGAASGAAANQFESPVGGSHSDGAGALNQAIDWPEAHSGGGGNSIIPDDWEDDFLSDISEPAPAPIAPQPPQAPPKAVTPPARENTSGKLNVPLDENFHQSLPLTDPPKAPAIAEPVKRPALEEPLLSERPPEAVEPFARPQPPSSSQQPGASTATQEARPHVQPAHTTSAQAPSAGYASGAATNAGQKLLDAMGLADRNLSPEQVEEVCEMVGELMPVIVTGMMQVLRSRTSIKNEFRMNVTTIQPVENNPLKFSATAEDAMDNMFIRKGAAYKQPVDAFREGFDGIGEHQVAIIAGIRAAFKGMMDSFDPERLEQQFDRQNKGVTLPGMQKARYWSSYTDYFKGFVDNMENSFQYLFGDVFVEAYEDQLRKLTAERKRQP